MASRALNEGRKYVVSSTLQSADRGPTTILDSLGAVRELKGHDGGELQVHGSAYELVTSRTTSTGATYVELRFEIGCERCAALEMPDECRGVAPAADHDHVDVTRGEQLEDARPLAPAKRADPADERPRDPVIDAELGTRLAPEAQPAADDPPQACHRREVEEDRGVRGREPLLQHAELHPVDHPSVTRHELTVAFAPLSRGGLDPSAVDLAPVVPVDVDHRELEQLTEPARKRGFARSSTADHRNPLHRSNVRLGPD